MSDDSEDADPSRDGTESDESDDGLLPPDEPDGDGAPDEEGFSYTTQEDHQPPGTDGNRDVDAPLDDLVERTRDSDTGEDDVMDAFEEVDVGTTDTDDLWQQLEQERIEETVDEPRSDTERDVRVVEKRDYCMRCQFFSAPPDVRCTHDRGEILEMTDTDHFKLADCPILRGEEELENLRR